VLWPLVAGLLAAGAHIAADDEAPPPPPVSAQAKPAKAEVTVGEAFPVELIAQGPPGTTWTFPSQVSEDTVEMTERPEARPRPDRRSYDASIFAVTDAALPPLTVGYRLADGTTGEVQTAPVPLKIGSLLARDPKERQLADIKPPVDVGILPREFWLAVLRALTHSVIGLLALVAAAALAFWLWRKVRRRRRLETVLATRPEVVPADAEALAALDRLAGSRLLEREEYRAFYIELAEIAKRYLERRLGAPVLEMTTAETLAFLRQDAHGNAFVDLVRDVADAADQIKFARGAGARERAEAHLGAVRRLVVDLEGRLRPNFFEPPAEAPRRAS
jgi:hypothetical protein